MKPYGYIYKTTNLLNGMLYIGMKISHTFCPSYLGSGKYLKNAVRKHGRENFTVEPIEFSYDKSTQLELERHYIKFYRGFYGQGLLYNISDGGEGFDHEAAVQASKLAGNLGSVAIAKKRKESSEFDARMRAGQTKATEAARLANTGKPRSGEHIVKLRVSVQKQWSDPKIRHKMLESMSSDEYKEKMSMALKGKKRSSETKAKMRAYALTRPPEHIAKIKKGLIGRKLSEETKAKISKSHLGMKMSPESITKRLATMAARSDEEKAATQAKRLKTCCTPEFRAKQRANVINRSDVEKAVIHAKYQATWAARSDEEKAKTKIKRRKANLGRKASPEVRANMSKAHTGKRHSPETIAKLRAIPRDANGYFIKGVHN